MQSSHRTLVVAIVTAAMLGSVADEAFGQAPAGEGQVPTGEEKDKTLYAIGTLMAGQLKPLGVTEAEFNEIEKGLRDAALGKKLEVEAIDYREKINALTEARHRASSAAEVAEAKSFVANAAAEKGAVTTESGLVYLEEKAGSGASPGPEDTVEVHYHGTLRDGTVFDSSVQKGAPVKFPLNRVIPCWTEGLQRMKPGGKSRLVCPASIAYGDRGAPPAIAGGAALSFEVELIAVTPK